MRLCSISEDKSGLYQVLYSLRPQIILAAQCIYDEWDQSGDDSGGGICDEIASAIGDILAQFDINHTYGGHEGDDHAYIIAYNDYESYVVDITPETYEHGGGYSWTKIPDVQFELDDVIIARVHRPDWIK